MFGEKRPGKMYDVYWYQSYIHIFFSCFFIFTSFNTTPRILLIKIILIQNCKSEKGDSFSWASACMQMCRHQCSVPK